MTESVGTPFVVVAQRDILQGLDAGCRTHLCDIAPAVLCVEQRGVMYRVYLSHLLNVFTVRSSVLDRPTDSRSIVTFPYIS